MLHLIPLPELHLLNSESSENANRMLWAKRLSLKNQHSGMCTACNEIEGRIQCPWCMEPFPRVPHGHPQQAHSCAYTTQCLNIHALGEQWIEEVTDVEVVQTSQEECLEGEHLKFKAHIRGWKTEIRKERCQQFLDKNDYNLRRALLRPLWKDVLLMPQA